MTTAATSATVTVAGLLVDCIAEREPGLHSLIVSTPCSNKHALVLTGFGDADAAALLPMVGKEITVSIEVAR